MTATETTQLQDAQVTLVTDPIAKSPCDVRLTRTSYSSLLTLHRCPRQYELDRMLGECRESNVTLAFGTVVGEGIQSVIRGDSWEQTLLLMFTMWNIDFLDAEERDNKSFPDAVFAVERFAKIANVTLLRNYRMAYTAEGKPACELRFKIELLDGFYYTGSIDVVLEHIVTGELLVLEIKTTRFNSVNEASYKNSMQALSYSVVLDTLAPKGSEYKVLYLVYKSGAREYELFQFNKSFKARANWVRALLADIEVIQLYASNDTFPMHGESCFSFGRQCERYNSCHLDHSKFFAAGLATYNKKVETERFDAVFSLDSIIEALLTKNQHVRDSFSDAVDAATIIDDVSDILPDGGDLILESL